MYILKYEGILEEFLDEAQAEERADKIALEQKVAVVVFKAINTVEWKLTKTKFKKVPVVEIPKVILETENKAIPEIVEVKEEILELPKNSSVTENKEVVGVAMGFAKRLYDKATVSIPEGLTTLNQVETLILTAKDSINEISDNLISNLDILEGLKDLKDFRDIEGSEGNEDTPPSFKDLMFGSQIGEAIEEFNEVIEIDLEELELEPAIVTQIKELGAEVEPEPVPEKQSQDLDNIPELYNEAIKKDNKLMGDMKRLDSFYDLVEKTNTLVEIQDLCDSYSDLKDSEVSTEYTTTKKANFDRILEKDIMRELSSVQTEELNYILDRYPEYIQVLEKVSKKIKSLEVKFNGIADLEYNIGSDIDLPKDERSLEEIVKTAFKNCLTINALSSVKDNFKIKYPEIVDENWFKKLYYDKASVFNASTNSHIPKFADRMK